MCGRYATTRSSVDLSALFEALDETDSAGPSWNVAPTDPVPVVRLAPAGQRLLSTARWGLLPHWARHPRDGARMINARVETVATSPAYRRAFQGRRCLVPADGWYEWRRDPDTGAKQPYFMTPADGGPLVLAGLWASWGERRLLSCTILTMPARGRLAGVHDRMPLLLGADRWAGWLADPAGVDLLRAPADEELDVLEVRPVGPRVGNVRHNDASLIEPVPPTETTAPIDLTLFCGEPPDWYA